MSETPRTDEARQLATNRSGIHEIVLIDFARTLERELNAAKAEAEHYRTEWALEKIPTTVDAVEREEWRQERDSLRQQLEEAKKEVERLNSKECEAAWCDRWKRLCAERNSLAADNARLREALESIEAYCQSDISYNSQDIHHINSIAQDAVSTPPSEALKPWVEFVSKAPCSCYGEFKHLPECYMMRATQLLASIGE
jgi:DNA repair exonuclease SbcCD ATPase subunit